MGIAISSLSIPRQVVALSPSPTSGACAEVPLADRCVATVGVA